jgi:NAD(P)-dependent dehydrogenase (short-subunit alcohol dehydrogenase family)
MRRLLRTAALASLIFALPLAVHADDQQVASEVASRLKENLKGYSVVVKVQDGTAWLNGSVSNQRQMAAALQIAHQTQGVDNVVNNLTIGNPSAPDSRPATQQRPASMQMPPEQAFAGGMPYGPPNGAPMQYDPRMMQYDPRMMPASMPPAAFRPANQPLPLAMGGGDVRQASMQSGTSEMVGAPQPVPAMTPMGPGAPAPYRFDHPQMPGYAWPSYAAYPNYAAVTYPKQYSPTAWPYIGPFYPYPQVPLGWRKVTMEWKDGWWFLDFKDGNTEH